MTVSELIAKLESLRPSVGVDAPICVKAAGEVYEEIEILSRSDGKRDFITICAYP